MKKIKNPKREEWTDLLSRPVIKIDAVEDTVKAIFDDIRRNGDSDALRYTSLFDGAQLKTLAITQAEIEMAKEKVPEELKAAIAVAKKNITRFHEAQATAPIQVQTAEGVTCWQEKRPIDRVGLYIPGGTAPLFSSVLMLAVPAQLAGCKEIVMVTPPDKNGEVAPAIVYTAWLCGVTTIYKIGGIQAIASLTFGTESVPAVNKIFGPGNQYVTSAKLEAAKYGVAIDMPAGPSELMVVADQTANAAFVASDLLSQAEHGTDSQVLLVTTSEPLLDEVIKELDMQLQGISRADIAEQALKHSKMIFVPTMDVALDIVNDYGPEHLIICCEEADYLLENLSNAGSVFIGDYTPESAGDYASGTNHTLPTNGYAKAYSGVNLDAFMKAITFQEITPAGLKGIGESIALMADAEGLEAHRNAVNIRLEMLKNQTNG